MLETNQATSDLLFKNLFSMGKLLIFTKVAPRLIPEFQEKSTQSDTILNLQFKHHPKIKPKSYMKAI